MKKNFTSLSRIVLFGLVPFIGTQIVKAFFVLFFLIVSFIKYDFRVEKFYDILSFNPTIFRVTLLVSLGFLIFGICAEIQDRRKESENNVL